MNATLRSTIVVVCYAGALALAPISASVSYEYYSSTAGLAVALMMLGTSLAEPICLHPRAPTTLRCIGVVFLAFSVFAVFMLSLKERGGSVDAATAAAERLVVVDAELGAIRAQLAPSQDAGQDGDQDGDQDAAQDAGQDAARAEAWLATLRGQLAAYQTEAQLQKHGGRRADGSGVTACPLATPTRAACPAAYAALENAAAKQREIEAAEAEAAEARRLARADIATLEQRRDALEAERRQIAPLAAAARDDAALLAEFFGAPDNADQIRVGLAAIPAAGGSLLSAIGLWLAATIAQILPPARARRQRADDGSMTRHHPGPDRPEGGAVEGEGVVGQRVGDGRWEVNNSLTRPAAGWPETGRKPAKNPGRPPRVTADQVSTMLRLKRERCPNAAIASAVGLSVSTVKTHIKMAHDGNPKSPLVRERIATRRAARETAREAAETIAKPPRPRIHTRADQAPGRTL